MELELICGACGFMYEVKANENRSVYFCPSCRGIVKPINSESSMQDIRSDNSRCPNSYDCSLFDMYDPERCENLEFSPRCLRAISENTEGLHARLHAIEKILSELNQKTSE